MSVGAEVVDDRRQPILSSKERLRMKINQNSQSDCGFEDRPSEFGARGIPVG
jgi:hypothetical protein